MNSSNIYVSRLFKEKFKKIYNNPKNKFNFTINNTYLINIISNWKKIILGIIFKNFGWQKTKFIFESMNCEKS